MDLLQAREQEIFKTLEKIKDKSFVVVGGYAVNAYAQPRFSTDCDIVVKTEEELQLIEADLQELGYRIQEEHKTTTPYYGAFKRYEKTIHEEFRVSMDILAKEVHDRQTDAIMTAQWVFDHAKNTKLIGKTITEELYLKIITVDALIVMKLLSCRKTDMRDIFVLATKITDHEWIKKEVESRYDVQNRTARLKEYLSSASFRDGLQGIFGKIDDATFNKYEEAAKSLWHI